MTITLYGIPNCDSVKKARAWLTEQALPYDFVDFKKVGAPAKRLPVWAEAIGWDKLINRQGSTWRQLSPAQQLQASTPAGALALAVEQPSVIKRPVVEWQNARWTGQDVTVGFNGTLWSESLHGLLK